MEKTTFLAILLFASVASACPAQESQSALNRDVSQASAATPAGRNDELRNRNDELRERIEIIARAAGGRVGVGAAVLETGETFSLDADGRFPMQSVYKFPIGMAVLNRIDAGRIKLADPVQVEKSDFVRQGMHSPLRDKNPNGASVTVGELLRLAVSESDGTASDVLLDLAGGALAVNEFLKEIGVAGIAIADSEKRIGSDWEIQYRNWATPNGAVALLRALHEGRKLSGESRALLLKFMTESPTGPKRLKGLLPKTAVVAHKTGSSGTRNGVTAATNDIGIIALPNGRHLAVAVFVSDSRADAETRERMIAEIAKALWDEWGA